MTEKQRYLLMIKPFNDLRRLYERDSELKRLFELYDPQAVALKIIEVITENTTISMGSFGVELDIIRANLYPVLESMDKYLNRKPNIQDHEKFLKLVIQVLLNDREKTRFQETYTDYSMTPPQQKIVSFEILKTQTTMDKVLYLVTEEGINIFANILDMNLEDSQQALNYILQKQIEKGAFDEALKSANTNILLTKQLSIKINRLAKKTEMDIHLVDWEEVRDQCESSLDHIEACQNLNINQEKTIYAHAYKHDEDSDEGMMIAELRTKIKESRSSMLILHQFLSNILENFRTGQLHYLMTAGLKRVQLDFKEEYFKVVMGMDKNEIDFIIEESLPNFVTPHTTRIINLYDMMDMFFKKTVVEEKRQTVLEEDDAVTSINYILKFDDKMRFELLDLLMDLTSDGPILISDILKHIEENMENVDLQCELITIILMLRSSNNEYRKEIMDTFELKWLSLKLNISRYTGNEMKITRCVHGRP